MRLQLMLAGALLLGAALWGAAMWLRADARADLLKRLELQQIEQTAEDVAEREARKKEIENATPDELWQRACRRGMLPVESCS